MCKDGVLDVICLVYDDALYILNEAYIEIVEFSIFLGGHRKVSFDTIKEVIEYFDSGVDT